MSHDVLPCTGFSPLPPWVGKQHHQLMALPLPIGLRKERAIRLGGAAVGSLVWGTNTSHIKKIERKVGSWPLVVAVKRQDITIN